MRIRRKAPGLKVVCNIFSLYNSTSTDLANLCMLIRSHVDSGTATYHMVVLALTCSVSVCFPSTVAVCRDKRVFGVYWGEIRAYSSLSRHPEFMECSWKSLKIVYIKLCMNRILSGSV